MNDPFNKATVKIIKSFLSFLAYINIARMGKTKDLSKDCVKSIQVFFSFRRPGEDHFIPQII
jgi:hypothetical protein